MRGRKWVTKRASFLMSQGSFLIDPKLWTDGLVGRCSLDAQGLLLQLSLIACEMPRRGYLAHGRKPIPLEFLARRCECEFDEFIVLLLELEAAGAARRTRDGAVIQHSMATREVERTYRAGRVVQPKLRRQVLEAYDYQCASCGSGDDLQIDHIKAYSRGGPTVRRNLQVLCRSCNLAKGPRPYAVRGTR